MLETATLLIFPLCMSIAAISDLMTMRIPNRVSLALAASFLVLAPISGLSAAEIGMHLAGAGAVFFACFTLFALNIMGGGDAKLLAAAALWFGFDSSLIEFLVYVAFIGGAVTVLVIMLRSQAATIVALGLPLPHSLTVAKKIPYGIAIAIGGMLAFPSSAVLLAAAA
ncbi:MULTISPECIES: A24 family peptidase [Rhizobium]|uniref:Peptidase n=1 Tax=Rhizobium tropici TaxID=398 RepID=A0A6P1C5V1_RHITR|nr:MULTISPECIES: prepilin peptidase [Rhizobium]AGB69685.1 prepilin peptidase protein [Rhizobium tropici CIAT 899]MBB4244067.1 prepilin peptidase CpaA [Rhizobium tropici]MBB5595096.1 prepilin peptidase CpaA [Rhizobium tropici]MBB6494406.1 prepilin peptidase CpaA [Rhizobium tropici]NEV12550.1 peptidase [Rhizobium tropici]